jgi:hypothetical protein
VSVHTIVADSRSWRFVDDDAPPDAGRQQILLRARLVDEMTGMPARAPITATTTMKDVRAAAVEGANVGLVGRPGALFALPHLSTVQLDLGISASGFLPLNLVSPVGAQPDFPNSFRSIPLGDVALRRAPTRLRGRIVSRTGGPRAMPPCRSRGSAAARRYDRRRGGRQLCRIVERRLCRPAGRLHPQRQRPDAGGRDAAAAATGAG